MSSFNGKRLPEISDEKLFEKFALDLWESRHPDAHSTLYGRRGQAQHGVDIVVRVGNRLIGIQCKAVQHLEAKTIDQEVAQAKGFAPPLTELVIVTTAPHDAKLVSHAQALTLAHENIDLFTVSYHGWEDLLRLLEDHQRVVHKHFPEFVRSTGDDLSARSSEYRLPLDRDLDILLTDEELALFCSEASWALRNEPDAILAVEHADEQTFVRMLAALEETGERNLEARKERSEVREALAYFAPKMRRAEMAAKLLLTDDVVRSPWLLGGCWPETAATMRRLMRQVFVRPMRASGSLTLKIGTDQRPGIVGYIDMDAGDRSSFEARCPEYNPHFFVGSVLDLGSDLGLKYALPSGIAALVAYSTGHDVPIELLEQEGATSIYAWALYPS